MFLGATSAFEKEDLLEPLQPAITKSVGLSIELWCRRWCLS